MGYREVVTGPPPDLGTQPDLSRWVPPCPCSHLLTQAALSCLAECASLSLAGLPLFAPLGLSLDVTSLRGALPKHLHSFSLHPVRFFNSSAYVHLIHRYI